MQAVAIVYGCYRLASELEDSRFPLKALTSLGATGETYYCADDKGQLVNVSYGEPCTSIGLEPYYMSCQLGYTLASIGSTTLGSMAASQMEMKPRPSFLSFSTASSSGEGGSSATAFDVPAGYENTTLLELFSLEGPGALSEYVQSEGPNAYLDRNPAYYDCLIGGTNILLAVIAVMMMGEGFSMAGQPANTFALGRQAAARVLTIINRVPKIDSFSESGAKPGSVVGNIEVRDVVFAYPSAPETTVCYGYNLSVAAGATVALCGPSGSGKSTIIQLLERFYDPSSGSITLDGADLRTLNVRWLRSQMG